MFQSPTENLRIEPSESFESRTRMFSEKATSTQFPSALALLLRHSGGGATGVVMAISGSSSE